MDFLLDRAILLLILVGSPFVEACMLVFFAWPCQNILSSISWLIGLIWLVICILVLEILVLVSQSIVTQLYASLLMARHQRIRPACGFILWVVEGVILECIRVRSLVWYFARADSEVILHNAMLVQSWFNAVDAIVKLIDIQVASFDFNFISSKVMCLLIKLLRITSSIIFVVVAEILECVMLQILHICCVLWFPMSAVRIHWGFVVV